MWWSLREEGWSLTPRCEGGGLRQETWDPNHLNSDLAAPDKDPEPSLLPPAGQFGAGTESYFSLLRFLLFLNMMASVLEVCMTLLPTWLEGAPLESPRPNISSSCGSYSTHTQGLVSFPSQLFNLLSGEVGTRFPGRTPPCPWHL